MTMTFPCKMHAMCARPGSPMHGSLDEEGETGVVGFAAQQRLAESGEELTTDAKRDRVGD